MVNESEFDILKKEWKKFDRTVDMLTSLKNIIHFPKKLSENQQQYKEWRKMSYEKYPKRINTTLIREGESVLMSVSLKQGAFLTLTVDNNDKFQLFFDWQGKKFHLPQDEISKMVNLREGINPSSSTSRLSLFRGIKEILWVKKYFNGNSVSKE